jgi:D-glycero-D-manno-heptose 1,7-bisphosphate phosphatase
MDAVTMAQNLLDGIGLWADVRCDMPAELGPVLFLDRDGVVIEDRGYVGSTAQTRVYPDAPAAVATGRALGYRVAIVTNQSGIARGLYDWNDFAAVQKVIDAELARAGAAVDAVLACAYHGEGRAPYAIADHFWRKPNPGMILEGLHRLNGSAAHSVMVGDKAGDVAAARAAELGAVVLIDRGRPHRSGHQRDGAARLTGASTGADAVVGSLKEAVDVLRAEPKPWPRGPAGSCEPR